MQLGPTNRSIPSLDGLRAVSIGVVVFAHWFRSNGSPFPAAYDDFVTPLATLGVQVFFVISGFLITSILLGELERTGRIDLRRFYFRRTLRIFPAYYFYILVVVALSLLGFAEKLDASWLLPAVTYSTNYFGANWVLGHSWSLAIEEQFYLLWPAVLLLLGKQRSMWIAASVVVIAPVIRAYYFQHDLSGYHFEAFMDGIAAGSLLAGCKDAMTRSALVARLTRSRWIVLTPIIVVLAAEATNRPRTGVLFYLASSVIYAGVVLSVYVLTREPDRLLGRLLNARPVAAVGVLSYSIYIWQQVFLSPFPNALAFPWNALLVLPAAAFSYVFVESPMLRARVKLEARWFPSRARYEREASTYSEYSGRLSSSSMSGVAPSRKPRRHTRLKPTEVSSAESISKS